MAIFLSLLIALLKALGVLLGVVLLFLVLPIFARGTGSFSFESDLDQTNEAMPGEESPSDAKGFSLEYDFDIAVKLLLGLGSFSLNKNQGPLLKVLGVKVWPRRGATKRETGALKEKETGDREEETLRQGQENKRRRRGFSLEGGKSIFVSSSTRSKALRSMKGFYHAMHPDCELMVEFDLIDPAYTGMVYGFLSALVGFFGIEKAAFYPRFGLETAHVSTEFKARVWLIPVHVLLVAARFMRDPEIKAATKREHSGL